MTYLTPDRDTLAKAVAQHRAGGYFATADGHRECYCGHVMAADESYETHLTGALIAAGAVIDASTLADDEDFMDRVASRVFDSGDPVADVLDALPAALTKQAAR